MLSYSQAKELIAEHEAIEKELGELLKTQKELYKQIEDKKVQLKAIEAEFSPEKKEEAAEKVNDEAIKRFKELAKKAFVIVKEEPKEPVEQPKAVSPYRIKGEK